MARNTDPLESVVVSVTSFETESKAFNVIPQRVEIRDRAYVDARDTRYGRS